MNIDELIHNMENDIEGIIEGHIDSAFLEMYELLETNLGLKFSGDIEPLIAYQISELCEKLTKAMAITAIYNIIE